jgi:hypothetical protein
VACTAVSQGIEITVRASRSDLVGTESSVQISYPTGETIGGGGSSSDWGDGTVRAAIPVLDNDDRPTGEEVYFAAAYIATGQPQLTRDRFNVGNVHVVEEHSETSLRVSEVTVTYAGPLGALGGPTDVVDIQPLPDGVDARQRHSSGADRAPRGRRQPMRSANDTMIPSGPRT